MASAFKQLIDAWLWLCVCAYQVFVWVTSTIFKGLRWVFWRRWFLYLVLVFSGWLAHMLYIDWQRYTYFSRLDICVEIYKENNSFYYSDPTLWAIDDCQNKIKVGWGFSTQLHRFIKFKNFDFKGEWHLYEGD